MERRVIRCADGSRDIYGEALIPDGSGPFPLVIYSHGLGYTTEYVSLFELARLGIASYAFDFPGGLPDSRSGGDTTQMSILTEADDLSLVLDTLRDQPFVDTARIVLCGASQGGFISAIVGERRLADIAGMVLYCPALVISEFESFYLHMKPTGDFSFKNMKLGLKYIEDGKVYDIERLRGFTKPVLVYHGEEDEFVPIAYARRLTDRIKSSRLIALPDADHMLMQGNEDRLVWDMKSFISRL